MVLCQEYYEYLNENTKDKLRQIDRSYIKRNNITSTKWVQIFQFHTFTSTILNNKICMCCRRSVGTGNSTYEKQTKLRVETYNNICTSELLKPSFHLCQGSWHAPLFIHSQIVLGSGQKTRRRRKAICTTFFSYAAKTLACAVKQKRDPCQRILRVKKMSLSLGSPFSPSSSHFSCDRVKRVRNYSLQTFICKQAYPANPTNAVHSFS